MLWGKDYRADLAHQGGACFFPHPVNHRAAPAVLKLKQRLLVSLLAEKIQGQAGPGGVLSRGGVQPGQLRVLGPPEGVASRKEPEGLQQIGLSLGIAAVNHIDSLAGEQLSVLQVAKALTGKARYKHETSALRHLIASAQQGHGVPGKKLFPPHGAGLPVDLDPPLLDKHLGLASGVHRPGKL